MPGRERRIVRRALADGIRPEPELTVSQWADEHRRLTRKASSEPGRWRTSRTPYLREPMDAMSASSPIEEVILMFAAQLGKSEAILNTLGYIIDHSPGPTLLVQPSVDMAKKFSSQRVGPLLETPRLARRVAEVKTRETKGSTLTKEFMGGVLVLTTAQSAASLRSMPVRWLALDEIDAYPLNVDREGSPIALAEARQANFPRRKRIKASTPTLAGSSAIEAAFEGTDQRRYFVPCPHCGAMQTLTFPRLIWSKLDLKPEDAVYSCAACEKPIEEARKSQMLASGEWRPTVSGTDPKVRGYHLNGLYSPWQTWGDLAKAFLKAKKKPDDLCTFTNTRLAETWKAQAEAPDWERAYERREQYDMGTVPRGGLLLTAGVDVQRDRLVIEIVAWGRGKTSWSVNYGVIPGDTADLENGPWKQLDAALSRTYTTADGAELPIDMLAVDSGYNTMAVYAWARQKTLGKVIAIKGQPGRGPIIGTPSAVEVNYRGRALGAYKIWPVRAWEAKSELYGNLRLAAPQDGAAFPPGWVHVPQYDADYFKQLTAERLVETRNKKGFTTLDWQLIPGRENHVLDARVYARAAASLLGLDRAKEQDWTDLENRAGGAK